MPKLPRRRSTRVVVFALGGGLALLVAAFLVVYFVIFPTSSPKPFKLTSSTATSTTSTSSPTTTQSSTTALSGTWKVADGSQAGYRVREKLAFLPAESDAVGRTSQITGSATFNESKGTVTITAASFNVAVDTLKSDRSMRDQRIHEIGLESSRYPSATFALSAPLTVSASALKGKVAHVSVSGTFNDPRRLQEGDPPGGNEPVGIHIPSGGFPDLPLERIRHERSEHRRLRQRDRKSDDGIRPEPRARVVLDSGRELYLRPRPATLPDSWLLGVAPGDRPSA